MDFRSHGVMKGLYASYYQRATRIALQRDRVAPIKGTPTHALQGMRVYQVEKCSFRSWRVHVCPAGHTCCMGVENR